MSVVAKHSFLVADAERYYGTGEDDNSVSHVLLCYISVSSHSFIERSFLVLNDTKEMIHPMSFMAVYDQYCRTEITVYIFINLKKKEKELMNI